MLCVGTTERRVVTTEKHLFLKDVFDNHELSLRNLLVKNTRIKSSKPNLKNVTLPLWLESSEKHLGAANTPYMHTSGSIPSRSSCNQCGQSCLYDSFVIQLQEKISLFAKT